jgi:hypothetical protein
VGITTKGAARTETYGFLEYSATDCGYNLVYNFIGLVLLCDTIIIVGEISTMRRARARI